MSMQSIFNFNHSGKDVFGQPMFCLDLNNLEKEKIYLIFPEKRDATFKVIDWFRYVVFLEHKDRYTMETKQINDIEFHSFSVHNGCIDICKRIAELFDLTCSHISQSAICNGNHYIIPSSQQILVIRPKHDSKNQKFTVEESEFIKYLGEHISASQLD